MPNLGPSSQKINEFIQDCLSKKICTTAAMIEIAQKQYSEAEERVQNTLNQLQECKQSKDEIENILRHLGVAPKKKRSNKIENALSAAKISASNKNAEGARLSQLDELSQSICVSIALYFGQIEDMEAVTASSLREFLQDEHSEELQSEERKYLINHLFKLLQEKQILEAVTSVPLTLGKGNRWHELESLSKKQLEKTSSTTF